MGRVQWLIVVQLFVANGIALICCFSQVQLLGIAFEARVTQLRAWCLWQHTPNIAAAMALGLLSLADVSICENVKANCMWGIFQVCMSYICMILFTIVHGLLMAMSFAHFYVEYQEQVPLSGLISMHVWSLFGALHSSGILSEGQAGVLCAVFFTCIAGIMLMIGSVMHSLAIGLGFAVALTLILECNYLPESKSAMAGLIAVYFSLFGRFSKLLIAVPIHTEEGNHMVDHSFLPQPSDMAKPSEILGNPIELLRNPIELPGLRFHDMSSPFYIPPERWCVSRSDLLQFVADVRAAWQAGLIPNSSSNPNPYHNDEHIGPTMYQVNEYFIKPRTLERGGASYAITLHPGGSSEPCDVFMTHAWAEGVFEFADKMLQNWPSDCHYLWVCFLANPQNSDISNLLSGHVMESPFAKALKHARKIVVIPNRFVSIYERMWCVLEAKIAMDRHLDIIIPTAATSGRLRSAAARGFLCLALAVSISFGALTLAAKGYVVISTVLLCMVWRSFANAVLLLCCSKSEESASAVQDARVMLLGFLCGVALHGLMITEACNSSKVTSQRLLALTVASFIPLGLWWSVQLFRLEILDQEARQLSFTSVRNARCSDAQDRVHILEAISGEEDLIDQAIHTLRRVGKLNARTREELDCGFNPVSDFVAGSQFSWSKFISMIMLWATGFTGNSWKMCGPRAVTGPPTLFGYWESQLSMLPFATKHIVLQAWTILVMFAFLFALMAAYASMLQPRHCFAGVMVDALWRAGLAFAVIFCSIDGVSPEVWSNEWSRKLAHLKVCSMTSSMFVGFMELACAPFCIGSQRHSCMWWSCCAMITMVIICCALWSIHFAALDFERCDAECVFRVTFAGCLNQCALPDSRPVLLGMLFSSAVLCVCLFRKVRGLKPLPVESEGVELQPIRSSNLKMMSSLNSESHRHLDIQFRSNKLGHTNFWEHTRWTLKFAFNILALIILIACSFWYAPPGRNRVPYSRLHDNLHPPVAISTNSERQFIAVGCHHRSICLIAKATGRVIQILETPDQTDIFSVAISGDGTKVLTGHTGGAACLWNVANGDLLKVFPQMSLTAGFVAISSDGMRVLISEARVAGESVLWNVYTAERLRNFKGAGFALSSDGKRVLIGAGEDRCAERAILYDAQSGDLLHEFAHHGILGAGLSTDATRVFTSGTVSTSGSVVKFWDATNGEILKTFDVDDQSSLFFALMNGLGTRVLMCYGNYVILREISSGQVLHKITKLPFATALNDNNGAALSSDGSEVLVTQYDFSLMLWSEHDGEQFHRYIRDDHHLQFKCIALSSDGSRMLAGIQEEALLWSTNPFTLVHNFTGHHGRVFAVALSSNGNRALIGNRDRTATLWNARSGKKLLDFDGHEGAVYSVAFSIDGTKVLTGSAFCTVKLWSAKTGKLLQTFIGTAATGTSAIYPVALSSDGAIALTASADRAGKAILWNASSGRILRILSGHRDGITGVALSSDGTKAFTGSRDSTAKMWNARSGQLLRTFTGHLIEKEAQLVSISLRKDATFLLASTINGNVGLFSTRTGQLLQTYKGRGNVAPMAVLSDSDVIVGLTGSWKCCTYGSFV